MAKNKNAKKRTKLLPKEHTGKIAHHKHTSYGSLFLILVLALLPIFLISRTVNADLPPPSAESGSFQTFAVVPAPVPTTAPQITNLSNGKVFTSANPVPISGTCPNNTLIKVFKNGVMGGATLCKSGSFQIYMDLFQGSNTLIARAYNANDAASPDSAPVTASLEIPGVNIGTFNQSSQFYITSDIYYRGVEAGDSISWPLTISGGQPPYAVSVGWGDGKTDLISQGAPGKFTITHSYANPAPDGSYTIFINATDSSGNKTYLQLFAIVNGGKTVAAITNSNSGGGHGSLITVTTAVQIISVAFLIILSFWIGERREAALLKHNIGTVA